MRAKRFMKFVQHPESDKRAREMVFRGRGGATVAAIRREPPAETPAANPLPKTDSAPKPAKPEA